MARRQPNAPTTLDTCALGGRASASPPTPTATVISEQR